jgi:hypothetical protein
LTIAGAQSFTGALTLTEAQQTAASAAVTRKLADMQSFPFLRPTETSIMRRKLDSFLTGNTTSGNIGDWGWSLVTNGTPVVGIPETFAVGKGINIPTGATIGNKSELTKGTFGSNSHVSSAVSFHVGSSFAKDSGGTPLQTSIVNNAKFWAGWIDSSTLAGSTGLLLVGWDTSISANLLIREKSSAGGAETTTDTGIAVPSAVFWIRPCFTFTIIGSTLNNYLTGVAQNRIIVSGRANGSSSFVKLVDANANAGIVVYNSQLLIYGEALNANSKAIYVSGVEVFMSGPNENGVG